MIFECDVLESKTFKCKIPLFARAQKDVGKTTIVTSACIQDTLSSRARLAECAREQRNLAYNASACFVSNKSDNHAQLKVKMRHIHYLNKVRHGVF